MRNILAVGALMLGAQFARRSCAAPGGCRPALCDGVLLQDPVGSSKQEFLQLFLKNHYPILKNGVEKVACCR